MKPLLFTLLLAIVLVAGTRIPSAHAQRTGEVPTLWRADTARIIPPKQLNDTIEVNVGELRAYGGTSYVVELEPKFEMPDSMLPVVIGSCEMNGIYSAKNNVKSSRPMTYDLMTNIFDATKVKLSKIVVHSLIGGTYYATIVLDDAGKKIELDSRPSDAINLALRSKAPVYVLRRVMKDGGEKRR